MQPIIDYLDTDVAYLIGLIVGRGEMRESEDTFQLRLPFRFERPDLEGYDQFSGFLAGVAGQTLTRLQNLIGPYIRLDVEPDQAVYLIITLPREHLIVRNLRLILTNTIEGRWPLHYADYRIPAIIKEANVTLKREFIIGLADISGNIRRSNRDQVGRHRVFIDVLNDNWYLPIEICSLLQDDLQIPVANVLWGHPNLRDPQARHQTGVFREHQIRIYAESFLRVGFYISHKQGILKKLAQENEENKNLQRSRPGPCPGYRRVRGKKPHPLESHASLPEVVRGRHFDAYWQICGAVGCPKAIKGPPSPLWDTAGEMDQIEEEQ